MYTYNGKKKKMVSVNFTHLEKEINIVSTFLFGFNVNSTLKFKMFHSLNELCCSIKSKILN
jgi:hypothetical protein